MALQLLCLAVGGFAFLSPPQHDMLHAAAPGKLGKNRLRSCLMLVIRIDERHTVQTCLYIYIIYLHTYICIYIYIYIYIKDQ